MSTHEQVALLLEDPDALHGEWFVRVSVRDLPTAVLRERLPVLEARASDPARVGRWMTAFLEGRLEPDLFEELLDREGLLGVLALTGLEPADGQGPAAPQTGFLSAVADLVCEQADAAIAWASWLSRRVAFALAIYWIVGLGLGLGVEALVRLGLGRIGM